MVKALLTREHNRMFNSQTQRQIYTLLKICKTHSSSLSLSHSNIHTHTHTLARTYVHVDLWPFCCVSDTISGGFISWGAGSAASWTHKLFRLQSTLMLPLLSQIAAETIILNPNTGLPHCLPYLHPHPRSITTLPAFLLHSRANSEPGIIKHVFFLWVKHEGMDLHHSNGCPHMYNHTQVTHPTHSQCLIIYVHYSLLLSIHHLISLLFMQILSSSVCGLCVCRSV